MWKWRRNWCISRITIKISIRGLFIKLNNKNFFKPLKLKLGFWGFKGFLNPKNLDFKTKFYSPTETATDSRSSSLRRDRDFGLMANLLSNCGRDQWLWRSHAPHRAAVVYRVIVSTSSPLHTVHGLSGVTRHSRARSLFPIPAIFFSFPLPLPLLRL